LLKKEEGGVFGGKEREKSDSSYSTYDIAHVSKSGCFWNFRFLLFPWKMMPL